MQVRDRIGRRMKLHDLNVLMAVAQARSMSKAARHLNTSQSAVSRSIAELEEILGVRLFDRNRQGIELTQCGRTLLDCSAAVFDELRQGIKSIEFLSDPTTGEIHVAGNEHIIAGLIAAAFSRLRGRYPGIAIDVTSVVASEQHRELCERKVDLVVGRIAESGEEDIHTEVLFHDGVVAVAGPQSRWSRRRKADLSEHADEPWVFPQPESPFNGQLPNSSGHAAFPPLDGKLSEGVGSSALRSCRSRAVPGNFPKFLVALRRNSSATQSLACGDAGATVSSRCHDAEESDDQPGCATVHRLRP
jgi:DNA-binding transcriptional LysR family regulator